VLFPAGPAAFQRLQLFAALIRRTRWRIWLATAAVHTATVTIAPRFNHVDNVPAFNKLARAFAVQLPRVDQHDPSGPSTIVRTNARTMGRMIPAPDAC
jgi:hypothetical protein